LPLVLLALVFAAIGLSHARDRRATNKGLAISGLACALLGLGICVLYAAAFSAAVSSSLSTAPRATTAYSVPAPSEQGRGVATTARIGDEVQGGSFTFKVTNVEAGAGSRRLLPAHGNARHVRVGARHRDERRHRIGTSPSGNQTLLGAQGSEFDADAGAALMNKPDSESFLTGINPGNSV
jgi:hypothetical protein